MSKFSMSLPRTWIARDTKSGGFIDRYTVPGLGEVRVMPSTTIVKAKRTAARSLRKAIASATDRNGQ